jgi:hypothetical protein
MGRRLLALVAMLGMSLLGSGAAVPASAQTTYTVDITSATLVAKGAGVEVELTLTCPAGASLYPNVSVTQRSGQGMAQSFQNRSSSLSCTGLPQTMTVLVVAKPGPSFGVGEAVVSADIVIFCPPGNVCVDEEHMDETIRIRTGPVTPVSAEMPYRIDITSATLVGNGTAVDVQLTIHCVSSFLVGSATSTVTQAWGRTITQGSGQTTVDCTGEPQTVTVRVVAETGRAGFKNGEAIMAANFLACDRLSCQRESIAEIIRIGK